MSLGFRVLNPKPSHLLVQVASFSMKFRLGQVKTRELNGIWRF